MSLFVMLIAGALAVEAPLIVLVPELTVFELEVTVLDTVELMVFVSATAQFAVIANRPPMAMPMTSQPSCSTGWRTSLVLFSVELLEQQAESLIDRLKAFLHIFLDVLHGILEVIPADKIFVHLGIQALHISPQRLDRVPDDLHPPASEDASAGEANVDKGLGFHIRHPLQQLITNDYDAGAAVSAV
jgi:hypothetical protein